jgi:hypothetical protein
MVQSIRMFAATVAPPYQQVSLEPATLAAH